MTNRHKMMLRMEKKQKQEANERQARLDKLEKSFQLQTKVIYPFLSDKEKEEAIKYMKENNINTDFLNNHN